MYRSDSNTLLVHDGDFSIYNLDTDSYRTFSLSNDPLFLTKIWYDRNNDSIIYNSNGAYYYASLSGIDSGETLPSQSVAIDSNCATDGIFFSFYENTSTVIFSTESGFCYFDSSSIYHNDFSASTELSDVYHFFRSKPFPISLDEGIPIGNRVIVGESVFEINNGKVTYISSNRKLSSELNTELSNATVKVLENGYFFSYKNAIAGTAGLYAVDDNGVISKKAFFNLDDNSGSYTTYVGSAINEDAGVALFITKRAVISLDIFKRDTAGYWIPIERNKDFNGGDSINVFYSSGYAYIFSTNTASSTYFLCDISLNSNGDFSGCVERDIPEGIYIPNDKYFTWKDGVVYRSQNRVYFLNKDGFSEVGDLGVNSNYFFRPSSKIVFSSSVAYNFKNNDMLKTDISAWDPSVADSCGEVPSEDNELFYYDDSGRHICIENAYHIVGSITNLDASSDLSLKAINNYYALDLLGDSTFAIKKINKSPIYFSHEPIFDIYQDEPLTINWRSYFGVGEETAFKIESVSGEILQLNSDGYTSTILVNNDFTKFHDGDVIFKYVHIENENIDTDIEVGLRIHDINQAPYLLTDSLSESVSSDYTYDADFNELIVDPEGSYLTFTYKNFPPGIFVSSSGYLSGSPTMSGTYNGSVTATDPGGLSVTLPVIMIATVTSAGDAPSNSGGGGGGCLSILELLSFCILLLWRMKKSNYLK